MPFSSHKKYPKTKTWPTLLSFFGQMTKISQRKTNRYKETKAILKNTTQEMKLLAKKGLTKHILLFFQNCHLPNEAALVQ